MYTIFLAAFSFEVVECNFSFQCVLLHVLFIASKVEMPKLLQKTFFCHKQWVQGEKILST